MFRYTVTYLALYTDRIYIFFGRFMLFFIGYYPRKIGQELEHWLKRKEIVSLKERRQSEKECPAYI